MMASITRAGLNRSHANFLWQSPSIFLSLTMKLSSHSLIYFSILLFVLTGCDKKTEEVEEPQPLTTEIANGLPSNKEKISGYLYVSATTNSIYLQSIQHYFNAYAVFGDPQRNLMTYINHYFEGTKFVNAQDRANINVGQVSVSGKGLSFQGFNSSEVVYTGTDFQNTPFTANVNWVNQGNKTFKPMNQDVPRNLPALNPPFNTYTISTSEDFNVDFTSYIFNADSVSIGFSAQSSTSFLIRKSVPYSKGIITFTKQEIQNLSSWFNLTMNIQAFNYSNRTVEDKIYVFELSRKVQIQGYITN